MRALLLIFGLIGCALVVGATARYGMLTSDSQADGYISAGLFSFVAVAGLSGHAVAVRIWQRSRPWSIVIGVVSFGAMVVSLSNSLGFVALRGSQGQEQAAKANTAIARAQAELDGLLRQRDAVPAFAPATAEQVKAAKEAATTATGVREVECVKRGPFCRQREADEQAAIERHVVAEANLAATLVVADLDNQIKAARNKLTASGTERVENPHGKALASLAALFKLPADAMTASTAQQALLAIMLELVIVACFVAHEVLGQEARDEPARLTRTLDAQPEEASNPNARSQWATEARRAVRGPEARRIDGNANWDSEQILSARGSPQRTGADVDRIAFRRVSRLVSRQRPGGCIRGGLRGGDQGDLRQAGNRN